MTARTTCLLVLCAVSAAGGCSTQQQQRVAYYQPVTPRFQQGAAPERPAAGPHRWEHGFTWNLSGWD